MSDSSRSSGGIGFFSALGLLFIGLKLGKVIDWSWWWVTLPLWGTLALMVAILLLFFLARLVVLFFRAIGNARDERRRQRALWRDEGL